MTKTLLKKPTIIPKTPGIYIFRDARAKPLYIGKAANLRARIQSYFQKNIPDRIIRLRAEAYSLDIVVLPNEFDALIKEAELIKRHQPKFNTLLRDDKSYYFVEFSKDVFPRIIITHRPHSNYALGPYTESGSLYALLRALRKVFPYCTCKKLHQRRCLNAEIGRCRGFCCLKNTVASEHAIKQYKKEIATIRDTLTGKSQKLIKNFTILMRNNAQTKKYEEAAEYRDKIRALECIRSHKYIIAKQNPFILHHAKTSFDMACVFGSQNPITRIEGYDVSMFMGSAAVASMVVFENGIPQKPEYKRFRIKTRQTQNDAHMLKEIINRRLTHKEWKLPDLMLIDGGMPQLRKVAEALHKKFGSQWPIFLAGLSKAKSPSGNVRRKASTAELLHIYGKTSLSIGKLAPAVMHTLQRVRDESHRFAKAYHSRLRIKSVFL